MREKSRLSALKASIFFNRDVAALFYLFKSYQYFAGEEILRKGLQGVKLINGMSGPTYDGQVCHSVEDTRDAYCETNSCHNLKK